MFLNHEATKARRYPALGVIPNEYEGSYQAANDKDSSITGCRPLLGMTNYRHSREGGNPRLTYAQADKWTPASAGVTGLVWMEGKTK